MRISTILCIIIAIIGKIILSRIFFSYDADMILQSLAGKNLVEGHGLTFAQVHIENLSKIVYEPLNGWPPGYSLLTGLSYLVLNKNIIEACFWVNVVFIILIIVLLYRVLMFLQLPTLITNFLVLFYGFIINEGVQQSGPTDLPAMFFCVYSCYLAVSFLEDKNRLASFGFLVGAVNAMASVMRYMYIGTSIVIPFLLLWNGWFKKDKRVLKAGFNASLSSFLIVGALLLFQHFYSGHSVYIRPVQQGLYFSNLLQFYPFAVSTFINLDFYCLQLEAISGHSYVQSLSFFKLLGAVLFVALLLVSARFIIKKRLIAQTSKDLFLLLGCCLSILTVLILSYLSIRNNAHYDLLAIDWVYVSESRYFITAQFFIFVFVACSLFKKKSTRTSKQLFLLRGLFFLFASLEMMHGAYFVTKSIVKRPGPTPTADAKSVTLIIDSLQQLKSKNIDVVFTATKESWADKVASKNISVVLDPLEINHPVMRASRPTVLMACLSPNTLQFFEAFLKKPGVKKIYEEEKFSLFTYYIFPGAAK